MVRGQLVSIWDVITTHVYCPHKYVIYVHMYSIGVAVRIVGGSTFSEGRVEIKYNGQWGTVCDDGWDDTDAGVVCKQLGLGSSGISYGSAYFGQGTGPIWLDNTACVGNESTLASCGHLGLNITRNCTHSEDIGVKCHGIQGTYTYVYACTYIYKEFCMGGSKLKTVLYCRYRTRNM